MLAPLSSRAMSTRGLSGIYYSAALLQGGVRVLKDGTTLKQTGSFYLAARPYAEKNGAFIQDVLNTFTQADALTQSNVRKALPCWRKPWAYLSR